jgi:NEDD4-binding protein 2
MKNVYIMSGVSGSGKSTYIKHNFKGVSVCSADDFFMRNGKYSFQADKLDEAHGFCLRKYAGALMRDEQRVVVDNTNLSAEEIAPYYAMARAYGYEVELITLYVDAKTAERNLHGVPKKSLERMVSKLQDRKLPVFWKIVETAVG